MAQFAWHPAARLYGRTGAAQARTAPAGPVIDAGSGALALAQALAAGPLFRVGGGAEPPEPGPVPMLETLTSGSSGTPRRIRRTQASWLCSFAVNARLFGIGPGLQVAVLGGLEQSLALYAGLEALHLGADCHLLAGLRPDRQAAALSARRIGLLYATPAQLRGLVEAGAPPLPDLRLILTGGSKLDEGLRKALETLAPRAKVREFYGAAEASFITLSDAETPEGAVGRAYPGVELALRGPGEVWLRSPYLFEGYAGTDPGAARWDAGWLTVGEVGRLERGVLYLSGRAGRMVTVADQNVFPEAIETFLLGLPGVRRAAVLPRPDPRRGTVLVAVLQGDAAQEPEILAALRAHLGPLKAPKSLIWRADWPALPSGKTDLAALNKSLACAPR